uniref:Motile sperm domain-containing protein 2 n=1 Tax=Aceria tosichella TaxID=561515 RepID=A0A6G1SP44_9ACAR
MFKSVFGYSNQIDLKTAEMEPVKPLSTDSEQDKAGAKKSSSNPMKKGRKKLSSMMNRLHVGRKKSCSDGGPNRSDVECQSENDDWRSDDDSDNEGTAGDDDDADSYTTAEMTAPNTTNEPADLAGQQAGCGGGAGHNKSRRRSSQHRKASIKPVHDDSKKFVLPEEECDIPTFLHTKNCSPRLLEETRRLLKERYAKNPDSFYETDYQRMLADDWTVTRFLLRRRLDPKRTAKLMEECGKFRKTYKMSELKPCEFPREFHQAGGLFKYAPDRVGNVTMYMRIKMYRRVPEISELFKAFILCVLEQCDVANGGRGTAVVFDLSGCGLQNVDLGFLSWLLSSFRNYCPKGVSYIMVLNLPWILNATCKLAMTWMSQSNRRALRFVQGSAIEEFIAPENLPDYLGGSCKLNYRQVPAGSVPAVETCHKFDLTPKQALKIKELFKEYLNESDHHQATSESSTSLSAPVEHPTNDNKPNGSIPIVGFVVPT